MPGGGVDHDRAGERFSPSHVKRTSMAPPSGHGAWRVNAGAATGALSVTADGAAGCAGDGRRRGARGSSSSPPAAPPSAPAASGHPRCHTPRRARRRSTAARRRSTARERTGGLADLSVSEAGRILGRDVHLGQPARAVAASQRPVLVRQRAQVQAVPPPHRGTCAAGRRHPDAHRAAAHRPAVLRRHRHAASRGARRASSPPRSSPACAVPAPWLRRSCAWRASSSARHHDRRDRRVRPPAAHRAGRLSVAAQLQRLPQERVHLGQRGDLPRHPGLPCPPGRRHPQPRRHRLRRRRAR